MVESSTDILASILKNFLLNSKCATDNEQKAFLLELLGNKELLTSLILRATENG